MSALWPEWTTAPTQMVEAAGIRLAYRRLGPDHGVPVVLLNHWGANLDNFDPAIVERLAALRPVYAMNYRGIGASLGQAPLTVAEMAQDMIAAIQALDLKQVDLIGFSLGGFVAQDIALQEPELVRKLVLAGTGPAGGPGIERVGSVSWPLILKAMLSLRDPKALLFFTPSARGRSAAKDFLARLKVRRKGRDRTVGPGPLLRQLKAIEAWGQQAPQPLETLHHAVLIVNGDHDIMVLTENSNDLARRIPDARIVLYPDAGHGCIFQNHEAFLDEMRNFLK